MYSSQMIRYTRRKNLPQQPTTPPPNINDIPVEILQNIVWCLPLHESARTSILSPHWKNLWLSNPNWKLTPYTVPCEGQNGLRKFEKAVTNIISLHNGFGIRKMKICHPNRDCGLTWATRVWMDNLASKHRLTKLEMNVGDPSPPPPALFLCETLLDLRLALYGACLNVPDEVTLPNLKHLSLHGAYFSSSDEFRALTNGCRALEVLKLEDLYCDRGMEMEVDLPELKVFKFDPRNDFVHLSLSANKLEILEFRGMYFKVPDGFFFTEMKEVRCLEIDQRAVEYLKEMLQNNLRQYGGKMNSMLRALREARTLSMNEWCMEYLTTTADTLELPYFRNLKQLEMSLWSNEGHMHIILYLVKRSPFLESLKLQTYENFHEDIFVNLQIDEYPLPPNPETEIHSRLKHIDMKLFRGSDAEMKLVEIFLASCPDLQQFRIKFAIFGVSQHIKRIVMEMAPTFPRVSPVARLTMGDDSLGNIDDFTFGF